MIHFSFHKIQFPQKTEPSWAPQVERWYQLDACAFSFCEGLWRHDSKDFQSLILASPQASTETDHLFAHGSIPSPQKFVHTLPNVRASMALQALNKKASLYCLQNGENTLQSGFDEFYQQILDEKAPLLAFTYNLDYDKTLQSPKTYGVFALSQDRNGPWQLKKTSQDTETIKDSLVVSTLMNEDHRKVFGSWVLEKISD